MPDDRCDLLCLDLDKAEAIRSNRLDPESAETVAGRARALSDPTRLTLAAALAEGGELCVCDLAWIAGQAENLVSHHLRALRLQGMVDSRRDGKMVIYSLTDLGGALLDALLSSEPASTYG